MERTKPVGLVGTPTSSKDVGWLAHDVNVVVKVSQASMENADREGRIAV